MTLITVEGRYEDGKVELAERPAGIERAHVIVTFLTEQARTNPNRPGKQVPRDDRIVRHILQKTVIPRRFETSTRL